VPWESFTAERLGMTREEIHAYVGVFPAEDSTIHRLLGHPDPVQGDMQLECQLVANGLYCGNASGIPGSPGRAAAIWRSRLAPALSGRFPGRSQDDVG
jgi:hypothetical protein